MQIYWLNIASPLVLCMIDVLQGFVIILEKALSLFANSFCGILLGVVTWRATSKHYDYLSVPVPLTRVQVHLQYLMCFFFNFAVVFDIVSIIMDNV